MIKSLGYFPWESLLTGRILQVPRREIYPQAYLIVIHVGKFLIYVFTNLAYLKYKFHFMVYVMAEVRVIKWLVPSQQSGVGLHEEYRCRR